ncbi:MAG: alpha-2-macroglobulin [Hyphomicrobiales bacterium]|nr:MAG: alpha-2-macroglobulin [Hyphomicrobiales bacterium]
MHQLHRFAVSLCAVVFVIFGLGMAVAADRSVTLLPDTDLPGLDYSTIKDSTLDACSAACADDKVCRAFTYNEKAKWCFLKGGVPELQSFKGATSGTIAMTPSVEDIAKAREGELPFPPSDLISSARYFAQQITTNDQPPKDLTYGDVIIAGDEALARDDFASAAVSYRYALALNQNDPAIWYKLATTAIARAESAALSGNSSEAYDNGAAATYSALLGFLASEELADRANGLGALAHGLEYRQMWRESIATYRASLALVDNEQLQARLDTAVEQHGFRIVSNEVDSESATPRLCVVFSDPLPTGNTDLSSYVTVAGNPQIAVETEQNQLCITGVEHGKRYNLTVRSGLTSQDGEVLRADVELNVYVPDRSAFVAFANNAYVMPAGLGGGLPITSVNAEAADVMIYRIGDRSIATAVRNGIFANDLSNYSAEDIANQYGELVWEGTAELGDGQRNAMVTTAIPVNDAITVMQPGAYVVTAKVSSNKPDEGYWQNLATQWFIVTDMGLTTVTGDDGIHAFVRSLTSAQPVANVPVKLVARNNEILGTATTDANGRADFAPGLGRGEGGRAPQLLVAETDSDYAFLDLSKTAFDLTDRGVEGRQSPGPLDVFAATERGVYRPTETVFLTALLRDVQANAVHDLPLTVDVERPDGVVADRQVLNDQGSGGYHLAYQLAEGAMRGSWRIRLFADTSAPALTSIDFLVEDFEPERLAFEVSAADAPIVPDEVTPVEVAAKYLYGATAPGLAIEADTIVRPVMSIKGFAGYSFGRLDDTTEIDRQPLGVVGTTDEAGNATAEVTLPAPMPGTKPLEAQILMRLVDTNGRTVERSLSRPVLADVDRIGIKPAYSTEDGLAENSSASFDIIAVSPDNKAIDKDGIRWTLSRIETNYQWYRNNGTWQWEAITTTRQIADGTVDAKAGGPVGISAPVTWGQYLLEVESTGSGATSSSYKFYAGYYYAQAGSDTPDTLRVVLDKPTYKIGETANLKLDPQFAGTALVMVVDDRIIEMHAVEVPEGGTTVPLTVNESWGPGAYVTAILYRPSDAAEKRMPARALGLAYADVDPADRKLDVSFEAPESTLPRQAFTTKVKLANVKPGEKAYVAVAAVDLGILNLTRYQTPDPDGYYFGQRQLGVEFRDLYGMLIDPTQGMAGALRVGGDGSGGRLSTPPATSVLLALHSGIVEVGADGTAEISFDMPDFAGTARLMAMAWTDSAVGHAQQDVYVRDPVVVTMSPPRFLRLDDSSRLLVEVNNISGPAGTYKVELITQDGLSTDVPTSSFDLAQGERTALNLGLTGTRIGNNDLKVIITQPDGVSMVKELTLGVRAIAAEQTTSELIPLAPGETVSLEQERFAKIVNNTGFLTLAVGPVSRLDVPQLLLQLDRYPYGCAEQVTSRAMPLLYLNDVANALGLGTDAELDQRIKDAIADLLSKQTSSGSFGLWGAYSWTDLWLDSYVTEFLLRAKVKGFVVPEQAMTMALDNLGNQLSYASDFEVGGEDIAYALYDLARAGRAAIGDLRYYFEARLDRFGTPLAKAQLGAALALYGDRTRSSQAFQAAVDALEIKEDPRSYRRDYGSQLRDTAAVLALVGEFKPSGVDIPALTSRLAELRDLARWTSTQDDAWTLIAASTLARTTGDGKIVVDGQALDGTVYRHYMQEEFDTGPVTITNNGTTATEMKISVTGIPTEPPPATDNGFTIERSYYTPDGNPADLSDVHQNDRFVVILTMTPTQLGSGQYLVVDPLPAGFEIENPDLSQAGGVSELSWISVTMPTHVESRTDQYVAAFRYQSALENFSTAYMVRATSPGNFVMPGATVEDMYRPEFRGNTDAGTVEVQSTGP